MPITDHQRKARQRHLGSSDAPRVIGVSPWGGPDDVYFEKTMPQVEDAPTEAMQMGNRLEPVLLDWAAEELGAKLRRNQFRVGEDGVLATNHDALVVDKPEGVEGKYIGPTAIEEWGQPGTDQVPTHVACQVQEQMYVSHLELVWIPVFMARYRPAWEMYCVPRNQEIIDMLVAECLAFWRCHVLPKIPPDPEALPSIELLKRLKREPGSVVDFQDPVADLVAYYEKCTAEKKVAEADEKTAKQLLIAELGEAEAGILPDGRLVTYLEQSRREYTAKATTFRVLKIKKGESE